jgi:hypothetical protein
MTTYHCIRLQDNDRFATSKRVVRGTFANVPLDFVSFGRFSRVHSWDHRLEHRPRIHGRVVASLTISPADKPYLSLYPIPVKDYPEQARDDFNARVLPKLRDWAIERLNKPDTSPEGYEQAVVEWVDGLHKLHIVRFQTGLTRPKKSRDEPGENNEQRS